DILTLLIKFSFHVSVETPMSSLQQWSTMSMKATLTKLSRTESGHRIGFRQNLLDGYSSFTKFHHFFNSLSNVIGHIYIRYLPSTHRVCFFQIHYGVPTLFLCAK